MLINLKKHCNKIDLILFTKLDRFSNAPDAYQMIHTLKVLDLEPQAIEQPLDIYLITKSPDTSGAYSWIYGTK